MVRAVLLLLLLPAVAWGQLKGPSYIGICHKDWSCAPSLAVWPPGAVKALGFLAVTFGEECPCVRRFLKTEGPKYLRVHIANCTCFGERGRRCGPYEPFHGESIASANRKLRQRNPTLLKRYRRNLQNVRDILEGAVEPLTVRLSLCLESEFSSAARRVLLTEAHKYFPRGHFVDSVVGQPCLPGLVCEKHGLRPAFPPGASCVADTDGDDYRGTHLGGFLGRARACEAAFLWEPSFNALTGKEPAFVDPRKRVATPRDFGPVREALR